MDDRRQARLKLYAAVWIGGLIAGSLIFGLSLVLRSNFAGQLGLLLIALGMAGSLMARISVFQAVAVGNIRWYAIVSLGLRIVAIGIFVYLAIRLHLS
jgi:hypothetical protein